ncbi:DNA-packaging protein [Priestia aryabhattai]|jgi:predicted phage terminase large subunit-like protein|uniref:DNA-packaging protein n=1 Tax=Priestia aryabhattai TaxID=412384 RepID=UPI00203FB22C|nr:terminase family protein [Priestia aryabhattai]MCM3256090.1 terminase family protein [Priestia aryabhattai]
MRLMSKEARNKILSTLTDKEKMFLLNSWELKARDKQLEPLDQEWITWMILSGRGFGKTETGAQTVRSYVETGRAKDIALIGQNSADCRDIMVSRILEVCPTDFKPSYEPSKRRLTFPNGATAICFSAEEPEALRGYEFDLVWLDELCKYKYPDYLWDMMKFTLRKGDNPRVIVTTTPKPIKLIKDLVKDPFTHITTGNTFENTALPKAFIQHIKDKYEGTRLGRQELYAEILTDNQNALWKRPDIDDYRVIQAPDLKRIVVAIDPSTTNNVNSDETGIVVAGIDQNNEAYVLDDLSIKASPKHWAQRAITAFHKYQADLIIAEANQGGDMIEQVLKTIDPNIPFKKVHASRGKVTRAEPVASKYEQGKVHHVGYFAELEDQLCEWEQGQKSPDRLDALVWALTELMLGGFEILLARA